MMKKDNWRLKDIIDLEYFLAKDEEESEALSLLNRTKRDRDIYLQEIKPLENQGYKLGRRTILRQWLRKRIEIEKAQKYQNSSFIPGDIFNEIITLVKYGLIAAGFIAGLTLAFSFLNYRGVEPVNVASYLGVFVLTQFILLFFLIILSFVRKLKYQNLHSSAIFLILSNITCRLFNRIKHNRRKELSSAQRDSLEAVMGIIRAKRLVYGSLFYWPMFILSQLFMAAFNIGLLCATLLKVIGTDIAFGWQSTIQVGSGFVFKLVGWIAMPWSWFVPAHIAHPSLAQVQGSHMVLKDGIYHLETTDLVSWWPFLCLALVFYGLCPRLILLVLGTVLENRNVKNIGFHHEPCESLYARMITPVIDSRGLQTHIEDLDTDRGKEQDPTEGENRTVPELRALLVLIPDEIHDVSFKGKLWVSQGYQSVQHMKIRETVIMDGSSPEELYSNEGTDNAKDLMIIQEAWQPPIRETLRYIKNLAKAQKGKGILMVGLIGKRTGGGSHAAIKDHEWAAWDKKIKGLGNPFISLRRLS